tara:strand:- start:99 stop:323 length:225 start_codon:yes stop_codon:yes gene_type:complete
MNKLINKTHREIKYKGPKVKSSENTPKADDASSVSSSLFLDKKVIERKEIRPDTIAIMINGVVHASNWFDSNPA